MPLPMMENSCLEPWGRADPVPCDPTRGAFPCRWDAGDHPARGELQQHADPGVCEPHGDGQRDPEPAAGATVLRGLSQGRTSGISARILWNNPKVLHPGGAWAAPRAGTDPLRHSRLCTFPLEPSTLTALAQLGV